MKKIYQKSESYISLIVIIAFCSIMLTGCKKEKDPELDYNKVYLLKKMIDEGETLLGFVTFTHSYEYDSLGRIVRYCYMYPPGVDTTSYIYNDSTSITVYRKDVYETIDTLFLELNDGLVVSENNVSQNRITRYKYNAEGYCILRKDDKYGTDTSDISQHYYTITYTYENGNLIREEYNTGYKTEYSYYNDKINTLGFRNKGMAFYGKSSKNLAKTENATDEFDIENRLVKRSTPDWNFEYEYFE